MAFFFPRPQHLTKTSSINIIYPPSLHSDILLRFVLWLWFLCVYAWCSCWCVIIFSFGIVAHYLFCTYLLLPRFFFLHLVTHTHRPTPTHFARVLRWRASLHAEMLVGGGWCWLDDVQRFPLRNWIHFGDPGTRNNTLHFDFVHKPVWELHTSAATPPSLLFSVASTTNLVGHNVFTSFVDRHKNTNL